nr:exosome component 10-like [Procambarus clarkii]
MDSNMTDGLSPYTGNRSLDDYVKSIMNSVRGCQKISSELQGWHHYRDYAGVQRTMEQVNSSITSLISSIFSHQDIKLGLSHHKLIDQFDMIREGNDALLERINSDVDEASGLKKNPDAELLDPVVKKVQSPATNVPGGKNVVLLAARNVQKPQLFFAEKINNSAKEPFIPIIKEKPNSMKPLSILLCLDNNGQEFYSHPYEYELQHWAPAQSQLQPVDPILPKPMAETPLVMVDTEEELNNLVRDLSACTEFAVDLEHHSFRSYMGLTCLMQISTRDKDYIVDPLKLRGKLTILNEVFTNPKITKVLHGGDHDILWLQRDCGVYVVNLFDTHQAAIVLEYPHRSLAALLARFCQVEANKVFQRADWRIRPLPSDFINYARQDSHYLLYIYDVMKNELISWGNQLNNLIFAVYTRSAEICMRRYEKPFVGPESHMELYRRSRKAFNSRQMYALRELYLWRDRVAREQDESPEYVLPKHMLLQITEVIPKEMQGVLACCNPIPPLVKTELLTIHTIIREALVQPLIDVSYYPVLKIFCFNNNNNFFFFGIFQNQLLCKKPEHSKRTTKFMSPHERYTAYIKMKPLIDGEKKKKEGQSADTDRVNKVREHFMSLTNNTVDTESEMETNHRVEEERTTNESVSMQLQEQNSQQQLEDTSQQEKTESKTKKKCPPKSFILSEEIQEEKNKKSLKRKSDGGEESPPKVQKPNEVEQTEKANEKEDGELSGDSSEKNTIGGEKSSEAFDYEAADYSLFQKAQRKAQGSSQKIKEKFKGKNQKGRGGKSSMKSFTWGNAGHRGRR